MAYEKNHIIRYHKDEKKKPHAFKAETFTEEEELDKANNKRMALITHGLRKLLRQIRQRL